jgi:hypothetical protein
MQTYTWIEWHVYNDMFTSWPDFVTLLVMYEDDYFRNHTWIWDGKPHWAYNTEFLILEKDRKAIEWTPNNLSSSVIINGNRALISLVSGMPNFKEYQMKDPAGELWIPVKDTLEVKLEREKHEMLFRAVNLAGVAGPEHTVLILHE